MGAIASNRDLKGCTSTSPTSKASSSIATSPQECSPLPSILRPDDLRVVLGTEMHISIGAKPGLDETDSLDIIRSIMREAIDLCNKHLTQDEEKLVEIVRSAETEVQESGVGSRSEVESNEEMELKSDVEVDVEELIQQMYDLHIKVKERREWAQEKALQAARKVSDSFLLLRTLRTKREIEEMMKKEIKAKEGELGKSFAGLEEVVKRSEGEVERVQMEAKRLEMENREMRAEIEAARLEKSETDNKCKMLQKRLKRIKKSAEMNKKQMLVLQGEVEEEKKVYAEVEEQIEVVRKEIGASEAKLEEERKLKEQAVKLVEAEHKATRSVKNSTQTRLTILTRKLDLDRRRHNEQVRSLRHKISGLKASSSSGHRKVAEPYWPCMFCKAAESSVVFLPCAHQVLCAECGKDHKDTDSDKCPCCRVKVEERIFVYGLGA
ncbi:RING/U-box superfamily protein [Rhynchospora pubera]|uniref:RING/U-box superfamily protein n=1 Tax=Rhynchospora pubera TaxID=906938 RepID=A0AAV8H5S0_9POAL|nr:RING/U-box superfamily protein [Rhynchospora pubera]